MGDNESLEPFFNKKASEADGTKRNIRFQNVLDPVDGYHISDQATGTTSFFGFLNKDGAWYIQRGRRTGS